MKRFFLVVFMISSIVPFVLFAEQQDFSVTLSASPEQASPYIPVTVTAESYSVDLNRATIVWSINGKTVKSGTGLKSITFRPGPLGSNTYISATIATIDGAQLTATKIVSTADSDIIWEAYNSYVPPFYKGKALPADEASIRAVAIPNVRGLGSVTKMKDFVYTWKRNYDVVGNVSGAGRSSFTFSLDYLNAQEKLSVEIGARTNSSVSAANTDIVIVKPTIEFYQKTADGMIHFEKNVGNNESLYGGSVLFAAPFGMSPKNIADPSLTYEWTSGNDTIENNPKANTLSVDQLQAGSINLLITNTKSLFEEARAQLNIGS